MVKRLQIDLRGWETQVRGQVVPRPLEKLHEVTGIRVARGPQEKEGLFNHKDGKEHGAA